MMHHLMQQRLTLNRQRHIRPHPNRQPLNIRITKITRARQLQISVTIHNDLDDMSTNDNLHDNSINQPERQDPR